MHWEHSPPVNVAKETSRVIESSLSQQRLSLGRFLNPEFQPGKSGQLHLCSQSQKVRAFNGLNAPKIK
jgi:hypothetical protein